MRETMKLWHKHMLMYAVLMTIGLLIAFGMAYTLSSVVVPALDTNYYTIKGVQFEMHGEEENGTLATYNAENYCMMAEYDKPSDTSEVFITHTPLTDMIIIEDNTQDPASLAVTSKDKITVKVNKEAFVELLSKDNFKGMSDTQLNFILSYMFKDIEGVTTSNAVH